MPEFIWELPAVRPEPDPQPEVSDAGEVDHVTGAVRRLVIQFQKPKMKAMVTAFVAPIQKLERAIIDLLTLRSIDTAVGEQLNVIGRIVGQKQVAVVDTTYRSLIRARIPANKSSGMAKDVLLVARLVFSDYASQVDVVAAGVMRLRILNYGRKSFVLLVENMDTPWEIAQLLVEQFLRDMVSAGTSVRLDFVVLQSPDLDHYTTAFRYSSVTSAVGVGGYGSVTDATVGGEMAAAIA